MAHPDPGDGKTDTTFGISMKVRKDGRWGGACLPARLPSHGMAPSEVGTAHSAARRLAQGPLPPPPTLAPCEPSQTTTDSDITGRVVEDCVRWMSGHALHREGLFTDPSHVDGKKLLALRKAYEAGKRPLRRSCGPHDPLTVSFGSRCMVHCRWTDVQAVGASHGLPAHTLPLFRLLQP